MSSTQPSEVSLDPGQLAEIINEALDDSPLAGIPRRVGQRNVQVVDANMIMRALNSPKNVIKMRTRVRKEKSDKTSNLPLPKDKKRFHSDRTKNEHLKDNSGKGKENENKPNKIT